MPQKFIARESFKFSNGAVGWRPGGPMDCLGPFAKVQNCPVIVGGKEVARLTCYATSYADTHFSVPACTHRKRRYVPGYFTYDSLGRIEFRVMDSHKHLFLEAA